MSMLRILKKSAPFLVLFIFLALLCYAMLMPKSNVLTSSMIDEPVPNFSLPTLSNQDKQFTQQDLKSGGVKLLNVWASWCVSCRAEHDMLMKIKNDYHVPIYGIVYKDETNATLSYLEKMGNPYVENGNDQSGDASVEFGVYGTPETYVIDPAGTIIYRHVGAMTESVWISNIYPLIIKYLKK
jgi:cytochrome c biogenesis protein CcmG/thiol:disulfide interchange protein DsbE